MIKQRDIPSKIAGREPFKGSNIYGEWTSPHIYAVYSYGPHWPLAIWTQAHGWLVNAVRYGQPTTRQHAALVSSAVGDCRYSSASTGMLRGILTGGAPIPDDYLLQATDITPCSVTRKQQELFDIST